MINSTKEEGSRQQKITLYTFHLGWVTFLVILVLLMRVWIKSDNIDKELVALEAAETEQINLKVSISNILAPLKSPLPDTHTSNNVFVPVYRSLYVGKNRNLDSLAATLKIHNTSIDKPLILNNISYFDGGGKEINTILKTPHLLPARASVDFFIDHEDPEHAPITSAFVGWRGDTSSSPPLVEAVIVGQYGTKSFSVISRGVSTACCTQ